MWYVRGFGLILFYFFELITILKFEELHRSLMLYSQVLDSFWYDESHGHHDYLDYNEITSIVIETLH